jgi:Ca-activated chloride channel family protein
MQEAKSDRLGLVAFSGTAFLECPLTIDDAAFQQDVDALDVNTISEGGTSLAEAINTAAKAFKEGDNYKVIVLFTDGEDNDIGAEEAAKAVAKDGVKIFTVGIGTAGGELLQFRDRNGNSEYIRDEQGNVVKSHLNEPLLRQIAEDAGGAYYSLSGADTMETLYQRSLAPLPKSDELSQPVRKRPIDRYHWLLAIGIVLLIVEMFFPERKETHRRAKNGLKSTAANTAATGGVTAIAVLLILPAVTSASPSSAMSDYKAGKFVAAQKEYERLAAEDKKGDARFIFNAGDAAYRATNYDDALKDFAAVLQSPDVKLQQKAYFNIGNVLFQQGEAKLSAESLDLDAVQEQWEQAVKSFQNAVTLDAKDPDAAHNLEYAQKGVAMIKQLKEMARQAKLAADNSVKQRQYHRALEIMQQVVQHNVAAKQFEDYVKRLQSIDEIATPTPNQH